MKDISFDITRRDTYFSDNKEIHEDIEIYYLTSGERLYFVENKTYFLQEGSVILVGSNRIHKTSVADRTPHERMLLRVYPEFLQRVRVMFPGVNLEHLLSCDAVVCAPAMPYNDEMRRQFEKIHELTLSKPYAYEEEICCAAITIFLMFQRIALADRDMEVILNAKSQKVYEIAEYLSKHMESIRSLDELCDTLFISKYYLCHSFKEITGMSVMAFLNAIRIRRAKMLLEETSQSIAQISRAVGFESIARFSNLFKRSEGIAPRDFRRQRAEEARETKE